MAKPNLRNATFSIMGVDGSLIPVGPVVDFGVGMKGPQRIRCEPIPGRNGIEYVPDFHGVTLFG